jgi:hypothetical protein
MRSHLFLAGEELYRRPDRSDIRESLRSDSALGYGGKTPFDRGSPETKASVEVHRRNPAVLARRTHGGVVHRYNPKPGEYGVCGTCGHDAEWHVLQSYAVITALRATFPQATSSSATRETTDESPPKISVLAQIMGAEWMRQESSWVSGAGDMPHPVWYEQADIDLTALSNKVPVWKLASCYRSMLHDRGGFINAVYAIHGAAFLAGIGQRVDLDVPRDPNEKVRCNVRVEIDSVSVQASFTARRDESRLEPCRKDPEGRDPATRESAVVRQLLESALTELPDTGVNMVLFAQIDGIRAHLERALFKRVSVKEFLTNQLTKRWRQASTTVFGDGKFARLGGVLWMRLLHFGGPLRPYYRLYVNPKAAVPMPPALIATLGREIERRSIAI